MNRKRTVHFFPPARNELRNAVADYNDQCAGLGFELAVEIRRTVARILEFSSAWTRLSARIRRCLANRFPYAVIFRYTDTHVYIV